MKRTQRSNSLEFRKILGSRSNVIIVKRPKDLRQFWGHPDDAAFLVFSGCEGEKILQDPQRILCFTKLHQVHVQLANKKRLFLRETIRTEERLKVELDPDIKLARTKIEWPITLVRLSAYVHQVCRGMLDYSNPRKFERCYRSTVKLLNDGLLDEQLQKIAPDLIKARNEFSDKRKHADLRRNLSSNKDTAKLWEDKFHEADFFLSRIDQILGLAEVHLGVDLAEISELINTRADSATDSITVGRAAKIASRDPKTIRIWAKKYTDFPAEWFDRDGNKKSRIRHVHSEQELREWLSKHEDFKKA